MSWLSIGEARVCAGLFVASAVDLETGPYATDGAARNLARQQSGAMPRIMATTNSVNPVGGSDAAASSSSNST